MAEKKKQHYVPKMFMRNFADKNKRFSVLHVESCKSVWIVRFLYLEIRMPEVLFCCRALRIIITGKIWYGKII